MHPWRSGGFSLVEVLMAVLVAGIVAAIAIPVFNGQRQRAKDHAVQARLEHALRQARSVWVRGESYDTGSAAQMQAGDTALGIQSGATFPAAGQISADVKPPAGVTLRATGVTGRQFAVADDAATGQTIRFSGAKAADGQVPQGTNMLNTPSVEAGQAEWHSYGNGPANTTIVDTGRVTSDAASGSASYEASFTAVTSSAWAQIYANQATNQVPVTSADTVYVSAAVKLVASSSGPRAMRLTGRFLDGASAGCWSSLTTLPTVPVGQWTTLAGTIPVPASATRLTGLGVEVNGTMSAGQTLTMRADSFMAIVNPPSSAPSQISYFDGDSPAASWTGTAHASPSTGMLGSERW